MAAAGRAGTLNRPAAGARQETASSSGARISGQWRAFRHLEIFNMSAHGHVDPSNKKIALLISVLALVLAFSETLAKGAQTAALSDNIEASNLWTFFQAKTIRSTTLRTAVETLELELGQASLPEDKAGHAKTHRRLEIEHCPLRFGTADAGRAKRIGRARQDRGDAGATARSRPITITNLRRRRYRSRLCSRQRKSSPGSPCSPGSPAGSGWSE